MQWKRAALSRRASGVVDAASSGRGLREALFEFRLTPEEKLEALGVAAGGVLGIGEGGSEAQRRLAEEAQSLQVSNVFNSESVLVSATCNLQVGLLALPFLCPAFSRRGPMAERRTLRARPRAFAGVRSARCERRYSVGDFAAVSSHFQN